LKSQYYKIIKTLKLSYFTTKWAKIFCCYYSYEFSLCGERLCNLYIDATVVLVRYVLSVCVCVELCDVFRFECSSNSVATLSVGNSTK